MLAVSFFCVIFSSLLWLIYAVRFIADSLAGISFFDAGIANILLYALLVCAPIFLIWSVFGAINQYINNRNINIQLRKLMAQMKKNQDYSDLLARVLIETEGHIKDGFVLSKFDLLIADMNELLSEIIRNCKLASNEQIENLWNRVQNGGKWAFGKVIIEVNGSQPNFQKRVFEKGAANVILSGTIMEFCARYLAVVKMLEKHDTDKIFLNMVENGIMGKVFSILAPVADELRRTRDASMSFDRDEDVRMPHPTEPVLRAQRSVAQSVSKKETEKKSFFGKIASLAASKLAEPAIEPSFKNERDPFSIALEKSFAEEDEPKFEEQESSFELDEPQFETDEEEPLVLEPVTIDYGDKSEDFVPLTDTQRTLDSLKKEWAETEEPPKSMLENTGRQLRAVPKAEENEDNFVYPFGGWTDEKNYQRRS